MKKKLSEKDLVKKRKAELKEKAKNYDPTPFGHTSQPVTRREFMATGLIPFGASLFASSLTAVDALAQAIQCGEDSGSTCGSKPGFINVHLVGGAMFASQYIVKNQDGGYINDYTKLGLGTTNNLLNSGRIIRPFANQGAEFFQSTRGANAGWINGFLNGVGNNQAILSKTAFVGMCAATNDDTKVANNNYQALDPAAIVELMGVQGQLPILKGVDKSGDSGSLPHNNLAYSTGASRLNVLSLNNISDALSVSGALSQLRQNEVEKVFGLVQSLQGEQARKLASMSGGKALTELVYCATGKNLQVVQGGGVESDPRQVANVASIWGINANTGTENANVIAAAVVMNSLNCNAGPGGIDLGGYDYHNGSLQNLDNREFSAGQMMGRIIATAAALNKKVVITQTTDGAQNSVNPSATPGETAFNNDSGGRATHALIIYNPAGVSVSKSQLGHFTDNQSNGASPISPDPQKLAAVAAVNVGALAGLSNSQILSKLRTLTNAVSSSDIDYMRVI